MLGKPTRGPARSADRPVFVLKDRRPRTCERRFIEGWDIDVSAVVLSSGRNILWEFDLF